ncbi:MAG: hypothetical protein ABSD62_09555 [Candidatus Limnocylindrales bacterium]|jgi:hypothetical protein
MGLMRRIRGPAPGQVPDWAVFLTASEYKRFRQLVDEWLRAHSRGFREAGGGGIDIDLGAEKPHMIGLVNLAQKCNLTPAEDWPVLIAAHLDSLLNTDAIDPDPPFESVKSVLKVRIYPEDFAAGLPTGELMLVTRPLAPGLLAALAIDYPRTVATVPPDTAAGWGIPIDELFEIGLANVREQDRPGVQRQPLDGGARISLLIGDSFFTATWVLMLDEFLTPSTPHGALVAVPNRHVVIFAPIVDLSIVEGIQAVMSRAVQMYRDGPGPISPAIYWRRGDSLILLPTRYEDETAFFEPPAEFIDVLNQLHKPSPTS